MNSIKKILIITSGGDAPGMNAAIRAITRSGIHYGLEIWGAHLGYQGIVENEFITLEVKTVANCIQRGGTILQAGRYPAFKDPKVRQSAITILKKNKIDGVIVLGGDGSFRGANLLEIESGIKVMGIPCTIDNDIVGTEYTIGFDTARNTALQAIDRIRDTAFSHGRNFLVEVMGRSSGFLAMDVGMAGGAELILIPEIPLTVEAIAEWLRNRRRSKLGSIIVVAEAEKPGWSVNLAKNLEHLLDSEYKVCILGHTQRGGSPTTEDRKIASLMGVYTIELLLRGDSKKMLAIQKGELTAVPFPEVELGSRKFSDEQLIKINQILCSVN